MGRTPRPTRSRSRHGRARHCRARCNVALELGHNYVGTEHILLALFDGEGVAAEVLTELGADRADRPRPRSSTLLSGRGSLGTQRNRDEQDRCPPADGVSRAW